MKEFGSDFHQIDNCDAVGSRLTEIVPGATFLAAGRQCLVALIRQNGWRRIWFPDYFCYEVIDTVRAQTGIEIVFYEDNPITSDSQLPTLPFQDGDVLMRMNFFGMRGWRGNNDIPCPVIEDHSHNPVGDWALHSDADWCFASIRKVFPLPEGGIMWSPKGHQLSLRYSSSYENEQIASIRWKGMRMKAEYLNGETISKDAFRKCLMETEGFFDEAEPSLIDYGTEAFLARKFNIGQWQEAKSRNWHVLKSLLITESCSVLEPEDKTCTPFSLVLLFDANGLRDIVRKRLIDNKVYPAILWRVPENATVMSRGFSERMLSIHCDGRYSEADICQMADIINAALEV